MSSMHADLADHDTTPRAQARHLVCRSCGSERQTVVLDLGRQPLANALVELEDIGRPEAVFPLEVMLCEDCGLVQVTETVPSEILFRQNYPYYSSFIPALMTHSREHALLLIEERGLGANDLVVEVASNDGYLLRNFVEAGIPVLGIDPAQGPAEAAEKVGVPTLATFFDADLARSLAAENKRPSVILGNNVLAHVSDINAFVEGFSILLAEDGIAEFEFPYLLDLIDQCAFDTIYHEHFFYYSLHSLKPLFGRHGLHLNDALKLDIHGGSLRLRVSRKEGTSARLDTLIAEEQRLGVDTLAYYETFAARAETIRRELVELLLGLKAEGKTIAAYGAAAKGATLLNFAGLPKGTIDFTVDRNAHKVGKAMPGIQLEICPVETLLTQRPNYLLILAWNFAEEIVQQQEAYHDLGGQFIVPIPRSRILDPVE